MNLEASVKEWLKKAREDFDFASSILPDTTFFAQVCFHFQQSAEKYLKAYIIERDLEFKKIHDLRKLLKICEKANQLFSELTNECDFLSPFYIDTRYPVHWPSSVSQKETLAAQEAARKIKDFVEKLLKG
ncbi:HEPN domain-containing protein [Candidatus Saganbacteria bacterium]|nr:HEPN domain-containing protein [Candidatus Saganbacteria bacterium]